MEKARLGKRMNLRVTLALVGAMGGACSSEETAKIGDPPDAVDRSQLPTYAGLWEGYVEAYKFFSGSDHVRLNLDVQGNGWLQVGDSADVLAPPTDPDVGWPPEYVGASPWPWPGPEELLDGIRYPIAGVRLDAERIRISFNPTQAYAAWCALQKPIVVPYSDPPRYLCQRGAIEYFDGECFVDDPPIPQPIGFCYKQALCGGGACSCDAKACTASNDPNLEVSVDSALADESGSKLEGTILLYSEGQHYPYTIRLKRK